MDGKAWWNTLSFYDIIKSTLRIKKEEKMLNIANVDESLKMYIRKELLVDDFFELDRKSVV